MRLTGIIAIFAFAFDGAFAVESQSERRVHRHKRSLIKVKPIQSLSELLAKSADLTKKFEEQANRFREKVHKVEEGDAVADSQVEEVPSSFLEFESSKKLPAGTGMRAMEAVTEEIMQFTDKMRRMGNDITSFSKH